MKSDPLSSLKSFLRPFGVPVPVSLRVFGRQVFMLSDELEGVVDKVPLQPFCAGVPLGEVSAKGFQPSLALLDLCKSSPNHIVIADEAEWLFTCGRDVFLDNIVSKGELKDSFLVLNARGDVLGLGRFDGSGKKRIVKNLFDRGDFLRREKQKRRR